MKPMSQVLIDHINDEMTRAVLMHGELPRSGDRSLTILTEEVGEVAAGLLDWSRQDAGFRNGARNHLREELIQVIATAVRWIDNINEGMMI